MPKKYNKYFIIGFNKTGTNTLHQLFLKNNLKSQHSGKWRLEQYQCFSDSEDIYRFEDLDKQYENSIFILNTRSLQKWIISRFKHGLRKKKNQIGLILLLKKKLYDGLVKENHFMLDY